MTKPRGRDTWRDSLVPPEVERAIATDDRLIPLARRLLLRIVEAGYDVMIEFSELWRKRLRGDE